MAFSLPFLVFSILISSTANAANALDQAEPPKKNDGLSANHYHKTCPQFPDILQRVVTDKQLSTPITAAGTLRVFFHDCIVGGCDASVLVSSNAFNKAEREAKDNKNLPGDAFDLVTRVKTAVELECPGVVSCADIMAGAARDLVVMVGGPYYEVRYGRKDGLVSNASRVAGSVPLPTMPIDQLISLFESKGFTMEEMVTLIGAHTIGFSHCKEFAKRLFHFRPDSPTDPAFYPEYAKRLHELCKNYTTDETMAAFNDPITPGKFDNMYYRNLQRGLGLLPSDQALANDPRTRAVVDRYAAEEAAFFEAFGRVMEKLSAHEVKTGDEGDIRRRCDQFNKLKTASLVH